MLLLVLAIEDFTKFLHTLNRLYFDAGRKTKIFYHLPLVTKFLLHMNVVVLRFDYFLTWIKVCNRGSYDKKFFKHMLRIGFNFADLKSVWYSELLYSCIEAFRWRSHHLVEINVGLKYRSSRTCESAWISYAS